ncbi:MAG: 3-mercaptopyruvate sulfurtransferase [Rhodobacteraceae bacterium]|nr:3-mercaptopyruvate sulfurtransferase [Paracoccaceae bacterium]
MQDNPRTVVSTHWLNRHLQDPDLRIVDGSWYLPNVGRDPLSEYERIHIPGARFFDIDEIADLESQLPHMAPPPEKFAARMQGMGIGSGHQIVAYDSAGLFSAARVWWLFRLAGHRHVAVLDGGLKKWIADGYPTEDLQPVTDWRHMAVRWQAQLVCSLKQVSSALRDGSAQVVDARPADRFAGQAPEPRAGLQSGHMPGALNLPYTELLAENGTLKPAAQLREALAAAGIDLDMPIITSCGSGVTAAIVSLALETIGHRNHALYDGSWAEWGTVGAEIATC